MKLQFSIGKYAFVLSLEEAKEIYNELKRINIHNSNSRKVRVEQNFVIAGLKLTSNEAIQLRSELADLFEPTIKIVEVPTKPQPTWIPDPPAYPRYPKDFPIIPFKREYWL